MKFKFIINCFKYLCTDAMFLSGLITSILPWRQHSLLSCSCHPQSLLRTWVPLACQLWSKQHKAGHGWKCQSGAKGRHASMFGLKIGFMILYLLSYLNLPWDLLMVIANAGFTGNCLLLQGWCIPNSPSFGMNMIRGMRTILSDPETLQRRTLLSMDPS